MPRAPPCLHCTPPANTPAASLPTLGQVDLLNDVKQLVQQALLVFKRDGGSSTLASGRSAAVGRRCAGAARVQALLDVGHPLPQIDHGRLQCVLQEVAVGLGHGARRAVPILPVLHAPVEQACDRGACGFCQPMESFAASPLQRRRPPTFPDVLHGSWSPLARVKTMSKYKGGA